MSATPANRVGRACAGGGERKDARCGAERVWREGM